MEVIALEIDLNIPKQAIKNNLLSSYSSNIIKDLNIIANTQKLNKSNLNIELLIGDARETITKLLRSNFKADAIFFDPFSPPKCPQLWTVEFFERISQCLADDGILATYSCSASVRKGMMLVGLNIGRNCTVGRRSPGTLATKNNIPLQSLSLKELEHLQTRASIPYRDPSLTDNAMDIIKRREKEQLSSDLEYTSHWKKKMVKFLPFF